MRTLGIAMVVVGLLAAQPDAATAAEDTVRGLNETLGAVEDLRKWPDGKPTIDELLTRSEGRAKWEIGAALATHAWSLKAGSLKRKQLVSKLAALMPDPSDLVASAAKSWLMKFEAADFADDARKMVIDECANNGSRAGILLMGILDLDDKHYDQIKTWAKTPTEEAGVELYATKTWWSLLAMARRGHGASVASVVERVGDESDPVLRVTRLIRDLEYVRRPEAIDYMVRVLNSDARLPPLHGNGDGTPCAVFAAEALSRLVQGVPIQKDTGFTMADVEICRKWAAKQTQWKFR